MAGRSIVKKKGWLGELGFNKGGGVINWFPGHMAAATRAIRQRLKLSDLVIEVRDARMPLSSAHEDLQPILSCKRRIIALNKKDLANTNIIHKGTMMATLCRESVAFVLSKAQAVHHDFIAYNHRWVEYFNSCKQECLPINAHSRSSVQKLLDLVEFKLKEAILKEPTLLVMVVGVPNVGKSALINSIYQIASARFPAMTVLRFVLAQEKRKRATVGPLPGVTQDIAGFKIAHKPSIYVLDTPGVLVPSIPDIETGLKLALAGSVKDSVVGEERIAQYLLAVLNTRGTPLHWKHLISRESDDLRRDADNKPEYNMKDLLMRRKPIDKSDLHYVEDMVSAVQQALCVTLTEFDGDLEKEDDLEILIDQQFDALQKAFKIPHKASEARIMISKKFLTLFRTGKLGTFILDDLPVDPQSVP